MSDQKNLWGGRFVGKADPSFAAFNNSFKFDVRLFEADVKGSQAYCRVLEKAGVITGDEARLIQDGLKHILKSGTSGDDSFFKKPAEDVHSFVEARLIELAGDAGRKLHTGRSRNDQVATDLRLWVRDAIDKLLLSIHECQSSLLTFAQENSGAVIPGYTHLQKAQPVLLAHWCLAYFEMLKRDSGRLAECRRRMNVMPLGSAALAGNSYPIDRESLARDLGFEDISGNSLDAVSDRDFCLEFLSCCSLLMVHLSRVAEDVILYSTTEFGFFELGDAIATGSSLMPQKKNPDSMELVRGKAGRVFGDLLGLLTTMKGLPLAYNKDMQEDKEPVFDAFETTRDCLNVTATVFSNITLCRELAQSSASSGYMNATELADYLVGKGMPFRQAHETVGKVVMRAIELGVEVEKLSEKELRSFSNLISSDVFPALTLESTLKSKKVPGGTSPERVAEAIELAKKFLADSKSPAN